MKIFFVVAVLAAALAAPGHASGPAEQQRISLAGFTDVNPCTGELVTFTKGTLHIGTHATEDAGGGFHVIFEVNGRAEGLSDTGTRYIGAGANRDEFNTGRGRAQTSVVTGMFNLVSQGSTDNFFAQVDSRVVVDANGEVKVEVAEINFSCRG